MNRELRIAFIGGGGANFGSPARPWDHATRLEKLGGVSVVGVADPDIEKAQKALAERLAGPSKRIYAGAKAFPDERTLLRDAKPDAVFMGVPPAAHGQSSSPHDMEMLCAEHGVHLFIEKPLSVLPPEEMGAVARAMEKATERGLIVSVGYMFRYSRAVERMQQILAETPGGPRVVQARYDCAYADIRKPQWWDVRSSGGPIVEQATHFCDLTRLLCGEVELSSISAVGIPMNGLAGALSELPAGAEGRSVVQHVPAEHRPPVATAALWRHRQGAIGSLLHGVLLHGWKYETELEVWADGLRMVLSDPYHACHLSVRYPHSEETQVLSFAEDDPFLAEVSAFLEAIRTGQRSLIRSDYADALRSHEFAWSIRRAYEASSAGAQETLAAAGKA